jgi:hemolysin activation/secretion protein
MSFGGATNRGFATSSTTRDNGFQLTNELRASTLGAAAMRALGLDAEQHQFVPFVFIDYGTGWNNAPNNLARMEMTTVGPGFSYQFGRYMSLRFTFGVPVRQSGQTGPELHPQFSATATF